MRPSSIEQTFTLVQQMLSSPADQVTQASRLVDLVQRLPPSDGELLSRPYFERGALVSLSANFFDVASEAQAGAIPIRIPYDCWIRGVNATAITQIDGDTVIAQGLLPTAQERSSWVQFGANFRGLFEVNWRLNGRQGFVGNGLSEIDAPADLVTGDGLNAAPLDWRLCQEDTIMVRVRNRIQRLLPTACQTPPISRTLPWIAVTFWAEDIS